MRVALMCVVLLGAGAAMAQQAQMVRSVILSITQPAGTSLPAITMDAFQANLRNNAIDLAIEHKFDPAAVDEAAEVLEKMYADAGQPVRVKYTVAHLPPRNVSVTFEVAPLP